MALGGVDLNLLVVLQALLEEGNVTRAGARVGMPQPAMSNALARLRRHFGDELLVRTGNGYTLTPLARSLLPAAQESMRLVGCAFSPADVVRPPAGSRTFRLSLSDYLVPVLGAPLLRRVRELAPQVCVQLRSIADDGAARDQALPRPDLLIGPAALGAATLGAAGAPGKNGVLGVQAGGEHEVIARDRLVYLADPANSRLRDGRLTASDLAALPHAAARAPDTDPAAAATALARLGITPNVVLTTAALAAAAGVPDSHDRPRRRRPGTAGPPGRGRSRRHRHRAPVRHHRDHRNRLVAPHARHRPRPHLAAHHPPPDSRLARIGRRRRVRGRLFED